MFIAKLSLKCFPLRSYHHISPTAFLPIQNIGIPKKDDNTCFSESLSCQFNFSHSLFLFNMRTLLSAPLSYVLFFHRDVSSPRNNIIHCYAILFKVSLKRTNFLYHIRRIMNTYFLKRPYIILFHIVIKLHHPFFIFCRCF